MSLSVVETLGVGLVWFDMRAVGRDWRGVGGRDWGDVQFGEFVDCIAEFILDIANAVMR
jgi:hypothetical protein